MDSGIINVKMILVGVDQIEFDDSFLQNDPKVKEFMNVK